MGVMVQGESAIDRFESAPKLASLSDVRGYAEWAESQMENNPDIDFFYECRDRIINELEYSAGKAIIFDGEFWCPVKSSDGFKLKLAKGVNQLVLNTDNGIVAAHGDEPALFLKFPFSIETFVVTEAEVVKRLGVGYIRLSRVDAFFLDDITNDGVSLTELTEQDIEKLLTTPE